MKQPKKKYFTSEYLDYKDAHDTALKLIEKGKRIGLLYMFGINTGLRWSDLHKLHDRDIEAARRNNNELILWEFKTNKRREVKLNRVCLENYAKFPKIGYLFVSQKRSIFDISNVNRQIKQHFAHTGKRYISTHSLRKTFARTTYDLSDDKEHTLIKLMQMLNHTDTTTTRIYLGITKDEINTAYTDLENLAYN